MERRGGAPELELPGFRFHPTEEELLQFYLAQVAHGKKLKFDIIPILHLYRHEPWELPGLARIGEREWYFFVPRDRRQASGGRPSRTTERGFWKATGSDRVVRCAADPRRLIGLKKTLVYYEGRAPRGTKTDWVMNEYRLPDLSTAADSSDSLKEDVVLCKIYRKAVSLKELEQRVAMEEIARSTSVSQNARSPAADSTSSSDHEALQNWTVLDHATAGSTTPTAAKKEVESMEDAAAPAVLARPPTMCLPELQVAPKHNNNNNNNNSNGLEWMQDAFLTQLRSPWTENWSPCFAYAGLLNL